MIDPAMVTTEPTQNVSIHSRVLSDEANVQNAKWLRVATILALGCATIGWKMEDETARKSGIEWLSFEQAYAKAVKEKKLMMVDVYTDWCSWCKVMDRETFGHPDIVQFARQKMVMAKMNAESDAKVRFQNQELTQRQLARSLGVTGYPTVVFFNGKGELLTNVSGYIPPDKFLPILEYLQGGHYEKMKFDAFLQMRKE